MARQIEPNWNSAQLTAFWGFLIFFVVQRHSAATAGATGWRDARLGEPAAPTVGGFLQFDTTRITPSDAFWALHSGAY